MWLGTFIQDAGFGNLHWPRVWCHSPVLSAPGMLMQEDSKCEAILGHLARHVSMHLAVQAALCNTVGDAPATFPVLS